MNERLFRVGLCATVVFAAGCGGEGSSAPPPEYPPPTVTTEAASSDAPADKPTETASTDAKKPDASPTEKPKTDATTAAASETAAPKDKPADKPQASDVPGANLSVGQLEADGLITKNIECKSEGGGGGLGLLGMVLVTAWMSPLKKGLDACASGGKEMETRVVWRSSGGKVTEIQAKGDAKVKACIEKVLRPGKPVFEGHCAATVVHGKK